MIGLIFLILRLPSLFEPYWYGDEGIYLTLGRAINHGLTLYSQIHDNKPPVLYYLAAFSQTVFGFRLLLALWMIPTLYFFHKISLRFFSARGSRLALIIFTVLTSIPLIEGNIANAEIFMLLPTLAAFYFFLFSQNRFRYLISGFLLGFAFTLKVPAIVEFGFLSLYLLFFVKKHRIANLITFGLSFSLPALIWFLFFTFKGASSEFIFAAFLQNLGYLSSWSTGSHSGSATSSGLLFRAVILGIFWLLTFSLHFFKKLSFSTFWFISWFGACLFGVLLSTRPYPHYLIQLLPPLVLILVSIFHQKQWLNLFFPLFLLGCLIHYKFYVYPTFSYYQNFFAYLFNLKTETQYRSFFGPNVNTTYQIANYIRSHSDPIDRLFVWGDEPYLYPLSERLSVSKYTVAYHVIDFNGYDHVIDQLIVTSPRFVVYYPMSNRPFPKLDQFLSRYYSPVAEFNSVLIYQLHRQ